MGMTPELFDVPPPDPVRPSKPAPRLLTTAEMYGLLRRRYSTLSQGNGPRYVLAPEVRSQAGFAGYQVGAGWAAAPKMRTCDLMVMDTWESGPNRLIGHEVKVSRSDWLRELKDPSKAEAFIPHVAEWWLVVADRTFVRAGELPNGWGLLAPAGDSLRAVVRAKRKEQPPIPTGMLAALLRSVQDVRRAASALVQEPEAS